ncbi:D-ribose pyranase [Bacillus sp. DJP31]|uniref:D-ribose pyranase n=1 Tax=Bacillus sp. DJP31 TaxID=3409789 RepID=UPI003BB551DB
MKKHGVLNSHITEVLTKLGHTDIIVIADCGLPIPDETIRIDISLKKGSPSFIDTLTVILDDMLVEKATFAEEITQYNSSLEKESKRLLGDKMIEYVSHEQFKEATKKAKAVIRTGESTPYANVILHAGVNF